MVHDTPADYDAVAHLYDRAFRDIRVRRDEWSWLTRRLQTHFGASHPRVLDIGCGNGSLLMALDDRIRNGVGVDVSSRTIEIATENARGRPRLTFQTVAGSALPCADRSIDLVISFLSFRYLDWNASLREIARVLEPNGRMLMIDMVKQSIVPTDALLLARSGLRHMLRPLRDRTFHRDVVALTSHPDWQRMLQRNPIRSGDEYRACFDQWFPGRPIESLNTTWSKRVIAFDSGPIGAR